MSSEEKSLRHVGGVGGTVSEGRCMSEDLVWVEQVGGAPGSLLAADNWKPSCCTVKKRSTISFSCISNLLLANSNDLPGLL